MGVALLDLSFRFCFALDKHTEYERNLDGAEPIIERLGQTRYLLPVGLRSTA